VLEKKTRRKSRIYHPYRFEIRRNRSISRYNRNDR